MNFTGFHIELTTRCFLACPGCSRDLILKPNELKTDIDFNDLKNLFPKDIVQNLQYIYFCGNYGDPIYYPYFHEICEHFFDVKNFDVTTNGVQNINFWSRVIETWPENSTIELSIDGLKDTNHIYRINSNWDKIEELFDLISTKKRKCKINWKFIVFEHNKHQIDEAYALSKKIGMNAFKIKKSHNISDERSQNGKIKPYLSKELFPEYKKITVKEIEPFCKTGDMHYINAKGNYYPCCWIEQKNRPISTINIKNKSLNELQDHYNNFSICLSDYKTAPSTCKQHCCKLKNNQNAMKIPNRQLSRTIIEIT